MPLAPGKTLGPYEVIEQAGAGGMGEVFKAKDIRLDRTVAIKVLPQSVAANPSLKQRFEREAKSISSLNHPNICTLYDIGHEDGLDYLVMEYIEGETLSDRISRGPLPMDELLRIAGQVADALDKAHGQGLIHRDLKPANVMLTPTGAKLLDFGLAKLTISDGHVEGAITQTTPLTGTGTIIGTLQYMAPEQLEGKEADARSDIFAFGAVLYEMATGKRAFEGQSQAGLIAGILEREPVSVANLNPMIPPAFERLVKKCLNKDPESRWQSARDLADELRWIAQSGSQAGLPAYVSSRRKFRFRLAWAVAVGMGLVAVAFAFLWFGREILDPPVLRYKMTLGKDLSQVSWPSLSPDGQYVAFKAEDAEGKDMVWIRALNSLESYPLPGTERATRPFWSPDSRYIAFIEGRNQLKKMPVGGGPAQLICETKSGADGTWGSAGYIIYDAGLGDSLFMVAASGGTPVALLGLDREAGELTHSWPWFLPDGKHYLFLAEVNDRAAAGGKYRLRVGNIETRESVTLFPVDARVQYCEPGYLVYFRDGILLAQRFDADKLETRGEAVPLTDQVGVGEADRAEFGLSNQGMLAYQTGLSVSTNKLVWVDRNGEEIDEIGEQDAYDDVCLSPDGMRLATSIFQGDQSDVWVYDLRRDVKTRITFGDGNDISPVWSRDGRDLYYANNETGVFQIYRKSAGGIGNAEFLYGDDSLHTGLVAQSPDGQWLYGMQVRNDWNIVRVSVRDSGLVETVVGSPYSERGPAISPNGKYLAYGSWESGAIEVYVLDLQDGGGRWQISSGGGRAPKWSTAGDELYYFTSEDEFVAVPVETSGEFAVGKPEVLFEKQLANTNFGFTRYEVTADPNKFIMLLPAKVVDAGEFTVVVNWQKEIESR